MHLSVLLNAQVVINADVADNNIKNSLSSLDGVAKEFARVNYNADVCYVIPFQIPTITAGSTIETAILTFNMKSSAGSGGVNIDLYGLNYRSSSSVDLTNDFYAGANDASADKLESSIIVNSTSNGNITTNATGSINLANYINTQISNGASSGDFIFLRLSPAKTGGYDTYTINSANASSNVPQLTLTLGTSDNPTFNSKLSNQIINEGATVNLDISATDPNGDNLTFTPTNLPSFVVLHQNVNGTASIAVSPQVGDVGSYNNISITVSDGILIDVQTFNITVKDPNVNAKPVISPIANQIVEENQTKKISISVSDADGGNITISVNNKPSFATLNQISNGVAELVLTPSNSDIGNYIDVEITANDGKVTVSEKFNIEVTAEQIIIGNSYYCDPVNGSMSNNGLTQATAWRGLQDVFANTTARNKLTAGDVVFLMNGAHGQPYIGKSNTDYITIKPAPGASPKISSVLMNNSKYFHFDDLVFTSDGTGGSFNRDYLFSTDANTTYIKITNCTFYDEEDSSTWTKSDWESSVDALIIRGGNFIFDNNLLKNIYFGVEYQGDIATEITNNTIDNFGADAIRALGSNALIENNLIRDAYVENYAIQHDDAIQMYDKTNVTAGTVANVIIRNNTIYQFADPITQSMIDNNMVGYSMQGIIQTDGHSENITVENNLVVSDHYHGITLPGAVNCRVQNNTVMKTPTSANPKTDAQPWIRFAKDKQGNFSHDCVMRNNISTHKTEGVHWEFDENATSGYNRNNLRENNITAAEAEYSGLFVNYSEFDFHLADASSAIDAGVNTNLTTTDIEGNIRMVGSVVDCGAYEVQASADATPPTLVDATDTYFDNELVIKFSESVTKTTAENTGNYSIDGGVNIISATLNSDAITVVLGTSELLGNNLYTVTANDVEDFAGNKSSNTTATFTYLCGAISASSYQDDQWGTNPPEDAFDGNMSTKWSGEGNGEWIMKNYCVNQLFETVSIAFGLGDQRIYYFSIEVSSDGINFTEIFEGQSSGSSLQFQDFDVVDTEGKYLRIVGGGNNAIKDDDSRNLWNNYVEISIDSQEKPEDPNLGEIDFNSNRIVVYPNPVIDNSFSIKLTEEMTRDRVSVRLLNLNGVEVYNNETTTQEFKVTLTHKAKPGIYVLVLSNSEFTIHKKLVVK